MATEFRIINHPRKPYSKVGLGDAVQKVALPISKLIDDSFGTNFKNCSSCAKRKEALNSIVPDIKKILQ